MRHSHVSLHFEEKIETLQIETQMMLVPLSTLRGCEKALKMELEANQQS